MWSITLLFINNRKLNDIYDLDFLKIYSFNLYSQKSNILNFKLSFSILISRLQYRRKQLQRL
jgi:hypothetical protein